MNKQVHLSRQDSNLISDLGEQRVLYPIVSELFGRYFNVILVIGIATLILSLYRTTTEDGWYPTFYVHLGLYVAVAILFSIRRRFSVPVVFSGILIVGYALAIMSFAALGLGGVGVLFVTSLCTYTSIFLGKKAGLISLFIGALIIVSAAFVICTETIFLKPDMARRLLYPSTWAIHLACYFMCMAPLVLSANGFKKKIAASVKNMQANNRKLEEEASLRSQTETALRESEARLRQVIDLVPHFIFAKDRNGRFILANKAVADCFGTTVENLTGKTDADFNPNPDEVEHFTTDDLRVIESGIPMEIPEETITDARGNVRILQTTKIPFKLSSTGDDAVLGVSTDITEHKRTEEASREHEKKYRDLAESLPQAVCEFNEKGTIIFANCNGLAMFGYTQADLESEEINVFRIISRREHSRVRETLSKVARREEGLVNHEYTAHRKDGTAVPVLIYTSPVVHADRSVTFRSIVVDMSEQKRIEQTLLESEAKYRSVVESSFVGFYVAQGETFRFVNERFCEIFGYSRDEVVGRMGPMDLVFLEDRAAVKERLEITAQQNDCIDYDFRAFRKDGLILTLKVFNNKIYFDGESAVAGTLIDITREKHLEAQLRQIQKMEAVGQLAGGIAHDFNNILTALMGYGSLLEMKMEPANPLRGYVSNIMSASRKASDLTKSLLAFSRKQPISLEPININDIIIGTEKLLKRLLTEDIMLKTSLASEDVTVMADATQIDQILFNLVTNARDSMTEGGILTVSTEVMTLDADFIMVHGFGQLGRYVRLSVSDTGTGMSQATKEKIFDPFFTTKDVGKGTGLGLFTVYGIVKQHNGYIVVYSEIGVGTTFHIYLPLGRKVAEEEECLPSMPERGKETILVAEDDQEVRQLIREVFLMYGYSVIEAVDGQDAVDKFCLHRPIDIAIIDSVMPRMNGRAAYNEIVKIDPDIKALFMSGHTRDVVLDRGIADKEFAFIAKPVSPNDLLRKVRVMLDNR